MITNQLAPRSHPEGQLSKVFKDLLDVLTNILQQNLPNVKEHSTSVLSKKVVNVYGADIHFGQNYIDEIRRTTYLAKVITVEVNRNNK